MLGTDAASVTGTELSEEERLRAHSRLGQVGWDLLVRKGGKGGVGRLGDTSCWSSQDRVARGIDQQDSEKTHGPDLFLSIWEKSDKIAETDLRWVEGQHV